jgi:hypothetical protein
LHVTSSQCFPQPESNLEAGEEGENSYNLDGGSHSQQIGDDA